MFIYRKRPIKIERNRSARYTAKLKAKNRNRKARMAGKK